MKPLRCSPGGDVRIDGGQAVLDTRVVLGDVVPAVHQGARHDVEEVDAVHDARDRPPREGNHVLEPSRDGRRDDPLRAQGRPDGGQAQRIRVYLPGLVAVGDTLVVLTVPAGVLPVNVDAIRAGFLDHPGYV